MNRRQLARLALRHEGDFWNAYVAVPGTMEGAILIGSIVMAAVVDSDENKNAFKMLMENIMREFIQEYYGVTSTEFIERPAPEHEKSGHA